MGRGKSRRPKPPQVKRGEHTYHLDFPLRAHGDWYAGGRVLRRRGEKVGNAWEWHALGVVLETPEGLYFVERRWLLERPNPWTGPPRVGPFPQWVDIVETFL